ncbi:MAG: AAA family ATPase [Oscillospiraceae bacterium]|nr:AAA family ATPase [Oscillospiraceae bacterium]
MNKRVMRIPAEKQYASELEALVTHDAAKPPCGWRMSPGAVKAFILGGKAGGVEISKKYIGNQRTVELCIAALMTGCGLLLKGHPGSGKSYLSELLAAAISMDSELLVQGTMGTSEEQVKYGFNYAMLISKGHCPEALIPSPIYTAMQMGKIARFEELSRCCPEIQDCLISLLSEKAISVPELGVMARASRGFALIATANTQDLGSHEMSAALARRFHCIQLEPPASFEQELEIVRLGLAAAGLDAEVDIQPGEEQLRKVVTILRELRAGQTMDGAVHFRRPSSSCSVAEGISALNGAAAMARSFGNGIVSDEDASAVLPGVVIRNGMQDKAALDEYRQAVLKPRGKDWEAYCE